MPDVRVHVTLTRNATKNFPEPYVVYVQCEEFLFTV